MKRLLILCRYFPPENKIGSVRPSKIAKYLAKTNEYKITVITVLPYGVDAPMHEVTDDGIEIYRVDSGKIASLLHFKNKDKGGAISKEIAGCSKMTLKHRIIKWLFATRLELEKKTQLRKAKKILSEKNGQYDVVFSTYNTEFGHLLANWYKKRNKDVRWIADFRDAVWLTTSSEKHIRKAKAFAKMVASNCDHITAATAGILETHEPDFGERAATVLYNGYDSEDIVPAEPVNDGILRMVYTGELYSGQRDLTPLFKALTALSEEGRIDLSKVLVTYAGNSGGIFEQQIKPFPGIRYANKGFVPRAEAMRIQRESNILILSSWCYKNDKGILTGKFFEYMGSQRPILCTVSGEESGSALKTMINDNGLGYCYESVTHDNDFEKMCDFLETIYKSVVENESLVFKPDFDFVNQFDYRNIAKRIDGIIKHLKEEERSNIIDDK